MYNYCILNLTNNLNKPKLKFKTNLKEIFLYFVFQVSRRCTLLDRQVRKLSYHTLVISYTYISYNRCEKSVTNVTLLMLFVVK